jgi:hypothetical protein
VCPSVAVGSALALAHAARARGSRTARTHHAPHGTCFVLRSPAQTSSSGLPWSGLAHTTRRAFVAAQRCRWSRAGRSRTRYAHAGRTSYGSGTGRAAPERAREGQRAGRRSSLDRVAHGDWNWDQTETGRRKRMRHRWTRDEGAHTRTLQAPPRDTSTAAPASVVAQAYRPISSLNLLGHVVAPPSALLLTFGQLVPEPGLSAVAAHGAPPANAHSQ